MQKKKIAIIGVGGRTGTMFCQELKNVADVFCIGMEAEIEIIKQEKLFIQRNSVEPEEFKGNLIKSAEFLENDFVPDIIFLCVKNPICEAVKFYYRKVKKKGVALPALVISQNGLFAIEDAKNSLIEVLGSKEAEKVKIIRMVLFNPIDGKDVNGKICMSYFLPIKMGFGKISGEGDINNIVEIFKEAKFEATQFNGKDVRNMEYSKLFLNLIGMASASRSISVKNGFKNKEFFKDEVMALQEYIKVVYSSKGNFVSFPHYPVKFLVFLFSYFPFCILSFLRGRLAKAITKNREGKSKDLGEIEYYNGAVIKLGREIGIETPKNKEIYKKVQAKLGKHF